MKKLQGALVIALVCTAAEPALGQSVQNVVLRNSFNPIGAGARGLGMGGAFIAVADDGTAASFNPAGLSQLRRTEFAIVGFNDKLTSTLRVPLAGGVREEENSATHRAADFVGLSIPFSVAGRNLTVELAYQRAIDLFGRGRVTIQDTINLSDLDPDLVGVADIIADVAPEQSGAFHTASLAAGYQMTSRLSLGLGLNYWIADWTARGTNNFRLRARLPGNRVVEVPFFEKRFDQDQSLRGLSLNAGFLLRYAKVSVGGIVRFPFTGTYHLAETDVETDLTTPTLRPVESRVVSSNRLYWPRSAGIGIAIRPVQGLTLAADYSRSQWSQTTIDGLVDGALLTPQQFDADGDPIDTFSDRNFFDLAPAALTDTLDTSQWRLGGEYLISLPKVVLPVRGGYFRDRSPVPDLGTDAGRSVDGFTIGTGINFSAFVFDVAFEQRDSEGNVALRFRGGQQVQAPNLSTEKVRDRRVVASLIYRFGSNDPIKRLLRYLFVGEEKDESD